MNDVVICGVSIVTSSNEVMGQIEFWVAPLVLPSSSFAITGRLFIDLLLCLSQQHMMPKI